MISVPKPSCFLRTRSITTQKKSFLSELEDETMLNKFDGEPITLPYGFWIMRNIRAALQSLTTQS